MQRQFYRTSTYFNVTECAFRRRGQHMFSKVHTRSQIRGSSFARPAAVAPKRTAQLIGDICQECCKASLLYHVCVHELFFQLIRAAHLNDVLGERRDYHLHKIVLERRFRIKQNRRAPPLQN